MNDCPWCWDHDCCCYDGAAVLEPDVDRSVDYMKAYLTEREATEAADDDD